MERNKSIFSILVVLRGLSQSASKSVDQNLRAEKNNRNVADLETKREETNNDTNSKLLFAQTTSTHLSVVENIQKSIRRSLSLLFVNSQIVRGREAKRRQAASMGLLFSLFFLRDWFTPPKEAVVDKSDNAKAPNPTSFAG